MGGIWNGLQSLIGSILSFFYEVVPNFGVAIILLTLLIGLFLFPLTLKQTRSMKAMQEIQPEIKKIQRDLKHDKQAQQQAMMALYRERGVNPAAGCLPLLLQMPIWFALFSVLRRFADSDPDSATLFVSEGSALDAAVRTAVDGGTTLDFLWMDLRISPSSVWSAEGMIAFIPYLLTIALVMFTAYWQQKQVMARNDQNNQQPVPGQAIMKIFPLIFGLISFSLPAGLVVYFAASQVFRIGQQSLIIGMDEKRKKRDPKPRATAPESTKPALAKENGTTPPSGDGKPKPRPQGSKKRGKKRRRG